MRPDSLALLWDVRNAAARIAQFIDGIGEDDYLLDELRQSAVERQLEIIGEAFKRRRESDPETAAAITDLHRIIGLRNVLAHGYATVDDAVVWSAASTRVPELAVTVRALFAR